MEQADTTARNLLSAMEKLIQIQRILLWDVAKIEGLSPMQIQFLIYLGRYRENLCTVSILAREFDLTKATVSDAINTLMSKGMASKIRGRSDRRSYSIRLTAKGRGVLKRIEGWQDRLLDHINSFSDVEKDGALMFFMKLIKLFYDDGIISRARMCITCENYTRISEDDTGDHYCRLTGETLARGNLSLGCEHYISARD